MINNKPLLVLVFCLVIHTTNGAAPPLKKKWLTLNGEHPVVVANGGMSGIFPESSFVAYAASLPMSLPGSYMLCDLKLTKDNNGYCLSKMVLQNTSNIAEVLPDMKKTYDVNGKKVTGWFGMDLKSEIMFQNITLIQSTFTRPSVFDNEYALTPPEVLHDQFLTNNIWINVEYDMFYKQHKLDMEGYIEEFLVQQVKLVPPYISSPEIGFLKSIGPKVRAARTKLFLKFPSDVNEVEPSTKDKYGSLLKKLNTIKSFATGILVPKEYIWPVNEKRYLEPATTLVTDAHKQGLEVFAYGFANDFHIPYNYSLDPAREYLQFIDNSHFSVDGLVTDFSSTASNAIACLAHYNKNSPRLMKKLVISHNGASGDYPGATDLAYQKAVDDGADIIDCNVQLSKDGVPFCQDSADLKFTTTAGSEFMDRVESIKEVNGGEPGVFSFTFNWDEIKALKPRIKSPYQGILDRNPAYEFAGKFMTLKEFLEFAKAKPVKGIMIGIENAGYLATKGHDIIGIVTSALALNNNQMKQKVMISSDETAVLTKLKNNNTKFQTVLEFRKDFSNVPAGLAAEIHKYADAVSIRRNSLVLEYGDPYFMSKNFTNAVRAMKAANLTVFISNLKNEYQSFLFDYYSDPYQEIATLFDNGVDGVITDFPATTVAFTRSPCNDPKANLSYVFSPITPGEMFDVNVLPILNKNYDLASINTTGYPPLAAKDINTEPIPPVADHPSEGEGPGPNALDTTTSSDTTAPPPADQDSSTKRLAPITTLIFLVALAGGMLLTLSF